jgi:glycosyltransferase involved in cell wall biosynthesis
VTDTAVPKTLHIVHTEASTAWGGQELRILTEAAGMQQRGHDITLLCPPEARIYQEAGRFRVHAVALPIGRKNISGVLAMRAWLGKNSVDVVNTHSSGDSWLAALACLGTHGQPPIVRTRHISAPIPNNFPTRWLYQRATRHIVTTGSALREQLIRENRFDPARITSVPTGIDTTRFAPGDRAVARRQLHLPAEAPLIGIVATMRSWKGHRYLIEAFAQLEDQAARLVIVGDGPQRNAIQTQLQALNLGDRTILTGNQQDVLPWLQAMDVFVLPSYANEGVPQAILQAMACELPVVTTPIGSIAEAVSNEVTGLLVEPHCVGCLRAAIERLLSSPTLRRKLGSAAVQFARTNFDIGGMLDKMEALFQRVRVAS